MNGMTTEATRVSTAKSTHVATPNMASAKATRMTAAATHVTTT